MPTDTFNNLPETKRERLIQLALDEFSENSYQTASISKIVEQAGIAKGSFYQYFTDKHAFYRYLVEMATEEKLNLVKSLPAPDPDSDLFGYLRWQFLTQVYFEHHSPRMAKLLYRAYVEDRPFPNMIEELQRRGTTQFFKQLLTQGIVHGTVSPWVDPDMAAFITEVIYYQFGKYFIERLNLTESALTNPGIFDDPEAQHLITNLMDILEGGMKPRSDQSNNVLNQG